MSLRLSPYPVMKDSGVPRLGEIPAHWHVRRQRNAVHMLVSNVDKHTKQDERPVRLCNYVNVYKNERISQNLHFMRATASAEEIDRFRLRLDDVIITKDSEAWNDIGVPALVEYAAADLVCGYHLAILRPRAGVVLGAFLLRALQSQAVASQYFVAANGVTRYGLSHDGIKSVFLPIPPLPEQSAIVRFLDHANKRIGRFIAAKRRLIELLNEQKQAIIQKAVTRGIEPEAHGKPSGIESLGVASHWVAYRLKHVAKVQTGITLGKTYNSGVLERRPYLRVANVQDGFLDLRDITEVEVPSTEAAACELRAGDVLMTEGGDIDKLGRGSIWHDEIPGCLHQNHIFAVRPDSNLLIPEFLAMLMTSSHGRNYFWMTAKQTTNLASTNSTTLRAFPIFLPSVEEQQSLLEYVKEEISGPEKAISRLRKQIDLIREYRTRLIADVVTGKLDVRGVELPPLQEAEDLPAVGDEILGEAPEEETELEPVEEGADAAE